MEHLDGGTLLEEVHHLGQASKLDGQDILPVLSLILDCQSNAVVVVLWLQHQAMKHKPRDSTYPRGV